MPYVTSDLISRTGYSGTDPCAGNGGGCGCAKCGGMGDFSLTPTTVAVVGVAAYFLFFRKKRR